MSNTAPADLIIYVAFDECCDSYVQDLGYPVGFSHDFEQACQIKDADYIVAIKQSGPIETWKRIDGQKTWKSLRGDI